MLRTNLLHAISRLASSSTAAHFFKGARVPGSSTFSFYPYFFDANEQRILLRSCLKRLDGMESQRSKRRRSAQLSPHSEESVTNITDLFWPDDMYEFQEGHFDEVITNFREMHVRDWSSEEHPSLCSLLDRLRDLVPEVETQTHILHLGTNGQIFPHVDNIDASGSWILGVSLGSPRILRFQKKEEENESFDVFLPSGSVYIQRDSLRFNYLHSVLKDEQFSPDMPTGGQRVSLMIRDVKIHD